MQFLVSRKVLDYQQYTADLEKANALGRLEFNFSYSARASYKLNALRPADWQALVTRMWGGDAAQIANYNNHRATLRPNSCHLDPECTKHMICDMTAATPDMYKKCVDGTLKHKPRASPVTC